MVHWLSVVQADPANGVSIWTLLLAVALAGAVGGGVNALLSEGGVGLPSRVKIGGKNIWQPGWVGTVVAGALAGAISWGLYGPAANATLLSTEPATAENFSLSIAALVGAALVGFGGGKWLSTEADRKIAQANTVEAAKKNVTPEQAKKLREAKPRDAARFLEAL